MTSIIFLAKVVISWSIFFIGVDFLCKIAAGTVMILSINLLYQKFPPGIGESEPQKKLIGQNIMGWIKGRG